MPIIPRSGAPVLPIPLVAPGFRGLNKQAEGAVLPVQWATETLNCVFDSAGRLSSRKGYVSQTTSAISGSPTITQLHELRKEDGTTQIISATSNSKLYKDLTTPSDITGTATVTVGNDWQFVNFNNNVYGVQQGEQPIVYAGTGSFADLVAASGTAPTGNCALAFSSRLWASGSDRQTLQYSSILDATKWDSADGGGSIDLTSVWPVGTDEITALAAFNGNLVIFGKNCILMYTDGQGSELGIDPSQMYIYDSVSSVGCIARDTVKEIEGQDLLFLSSSGVQSLSKLIQEKSNPIDNVSKNVRDYLVNFIPSSNIIRVKAEYYAKNSMYLLSFPAAGEAFCFDTRGKMEDGAYRVTEWRTLAPAAMAASRAGDLYIALNSVVGKIGLYTGYQDNGSAISFDYISGWLDLGEDYASYLKILKTITATVFTGTAIAVSLKWDVDFEGNFNSGTELTMGGSVAEWGTMEWGLFDWGGSLSLSRLRVPANNTGQYIRLGIQTSVNNSPFSVQQINLHTKLGRLAS